VEEGQKEKEKEKEKNKKSMPQIPQKLQKLPKKKTQLNSTQLNSTQLNPTQPNSTQPNPIQLNSTKLSIKPSFPELWNRKKITILPSKDRRAGQGSSAALPAKFPPNGRGQE
jgi:hypothetical protein